MTERRFSADRSNTCPRSATGKSWSLIAGSMLSYLNAAAFENYLVEARNSSFNA
jgi:hypothetical protein